MSQYAELDLQPQLVRETFNEYLRTHQTLGAEFAPMSFESWAAGHEADEDSEIGRHILPCVTIEDVKKLMDEHYSLDYVDYREDLDECFDAIQASIHKGCLSPLDERLEYRQENESDTCWEIAKGLRHEMENDLGLEEDDLEDLWEAGLGDEVRDEIYERNDSDPLKDLIRNTSDPVMFYDLGVDMQNDFGGDMDEEIAKIKEALSIATEDTRFDKKFTELIANASYGGRLVVYFRGDISEWLDYQTIDTPYNTIRFWGDVSLAIVDHWNGSGHDVAIKHDFSVPYDRENIFLDKTIKYNYTYEVCGMSSDWCEGTSVQRSIVDNVPVPEKSTINHLLDDEAKYKATFDAGKCTFGDMDMKRHRNITYTNDYPCGNTCLDCKTFWID